MIPPVWGEHILPHLSDNAVERLALISRTRLKGWISHKASSAQIFLLVANDTPDDARLARWWELITGQAIAPADARERFRNVLKYANV
jgi:hypothetical protein